MGTLGERCEVEIWKLKPYEKNAKLHPQEQIMKLAESIKEFGFLNPILIDKDYNIIAGHGRVKACELLAWQTIPCIFVEGLSEAQLRAYILADNRLTELGGWDMEIVNEELTDLKEMDFDISLTGFDIEELEPIEEQNGFEQNKLEDIEKLDTHYGVPYQGNKSRIADIIIDILPEGERLVDLFGGGVL